MLEVIGGLGDKILRESRAVGSYEQRRPVADNVIRDLFYTSDEFRSEDQDVRLGEIDAIFDLSAGIAEIQQDSDRSGFENAEINWYLVHAVHQKDRDLVALDDAAQEGNWRCGLLKSKTLR